MERFLVLNIDGKVINQSKLIENALVDTPFFWLLECELESVNIEIKDGILTWINGIFYWGHWQWGIWKNGEFRSGEWIGGVHYDGMFKGIWKRGVWKGGQFKGTDLTNSIVKSANVSV